MWTSSQLFISLFLKVYWWILVRVLRLFMLLFFPSLSKYSCMSVRWASGIFSLRNVKVINLATVVNTWSVNNTKVSLRPGLSARHYLSLESLSMQRFWATDGNRKCAVFLFNLFSHYPIYIVKFLFTSRDH